MSETLDVGLQLSKVENQLRNLVASLLEEKFGAEWIQQTGVTAERLSKWQAKKETENKRLTTGNLETRLIYFSDFYDLRTIIVQRHWDVFAQALGEKKQVEVLLSFLEDFRNPDAHQRGLLPYQQNLAVGRCGEIRARIARFRSREATSQDCFPRIDAAFDNHGQAMDTPRSGRPILSVGDRLEIVVEASDPEDLPIEYKFMMYSGSNYLADQDWSTTGIFNLELTQEHIGRSVTLSCAIRSNRTYHASGAWDDSTTLKYDILPQKT